MDHCTSIIALNPSQGRRFLEHNPVLASSGRHFLYAESKAEVYFPAAGAWVSSYSLPHESRFARIASCVPLFASAWCESYLAWLSRLLLPDGTILIPFQGGESRQGHMTPSQVAELYRAEGVPVPGTRLLSFKPEAPVAGPSSVRGWFAENNHRLVLEELRNKYRGMFDPRPANPDLADLLDNPEALDDLLARGGTEREFLGFAEGGAVISELEKELSAILCKYTYVVGSIRYKAALIEHIVETLHPRPRALDLLDIGGNMGCLAVELLLSDKGLTGNAVNRELNGLALLQALPLYGSFRRRLCHRFRFSLGDAHTYDFKEPLDVVTVIGTLLYVPREHHVELLSRAWEVLRPGGLLIVHENIKSSGYVRDHDLMFEPEELDALVGRFGSPIRRYPNTSCTEVPAEHAGRQALFRVVQKQ